MAKKKSAPTPRQPGIPAQEPGESSVDAALAAAQQGKAHKVAKPRAAVPPSEVAGDPDRAAEAPVNAKGEMKYEVAMQRLADRQELDQLKTLRDPSDAEKKRMAELAKTALERNVLTEQGWVVVPGRMPAAIART